MEHKKRGKTVKWSLNYKEIYAAAKRAKEKKDVRPSKKLVRLRYKERKAGEGMKDFEYNCKACNKVVVIKAPEIYNAVLCNNLECTKEYVKRLERQVSE